MTEPGRRLGHLPALDGLRALAVIAVFLFHAGVISGGFVGVDVFFVVSGFLITALAITEIEQLGRLRLGAFWARRARRLLPAVFLLCGAVVVASAALGGGAARRVGRDVFSTLAYLANWTQVGEGRDYFAQYETPSLLQHAWSLAIEEQFYLAWPLLLIGATWLAGRRGWRVRSVVGVVALALAACSVSLAWWWSHRSVGLNRLYYGTDTRAVGLALGAAAACLLANGEATGRRRVGRWETAAAGVGSAVLVGMALTIDGGERWLYGPGFLLIAVASLAVVTAASADGPVQRLLSFPALVATGRVSYGIYLWHWPVIVLLDSERTGLTGLPLGTLWVAATALLTVGSWFLIEQRSLPPALAHPRRLVGYIGAALVVSLGATATATATAGRTSSAEIAVPPATPTPEPAAGTEVRSSAPEPAPVQIDADPDGETPEVTAPTVDSPAARPIVLPPDRPLRVLIIGDSVPWSLGTDHPEPFLLEGFGAVDVRNAGIVGCPLLNVGAPLVDGYPDWADPASCLGDDRFSDLVADYDPDLLFMLFEWPGVGGGRRLADGTELRPCDAAFDTAWADAYETLVRRFSVDTTSAVVSTVAPSGLPGQPGAEQAACMNAALRQRDVLIFDYADWICPGGDCQPYAALRPDGTHFAPDRAVRTEALESLVAAALVTAGLSTGTHTEGPGTDVGPT